MSEETVKNEIDHILLVYRRSVVEFLGRERFVNTLIDILTYLYNTSIKVISLFEPSGLVYAIIKDNLTQKLLKSGFNVHSLEDHSLTFSRQINALTNNSSDQLSKESALGINEESQIFVCKINYLHASFAHLELLTLCHTFKDTKKTDIKRNVKKKLRSKKRRIPPKKSILQPCISKKLSISTPNIVICIHLSLKQILFAFNIPLLQRLYCLKSLLANATAPSKRYIYPFGPSGVPPWTLSEAEIYQVFGTAPGVIEQCIRLFMRCNRRNGK
ncbi:hypothetical protein BMR1_03g01930 [Babesia microti strain RI]|uniref:Uncharacterized protein n=1 Tax=Babesia microti (strain RI) TaxID=1133968 RepID=A0A0K3ARA9_BABMR|nr:hypothetical protein BMR1_03g01930 [Babesia microti strain RI]CTQ40985.1 hypothetical protein BMR1_03g01930 [Babesia microti strain RI]|eukprot:XP_012648996.1 hypothetical protein BMR1_03g01930 [Babesia microti strain RI]